MLEAAMTATAQPRVLVPVADGNEEIELVCIVDTLRRAAAEVTVAAVGAAREVTCSRGLRVVADALLADLDGRPFDLIALCGGMPGAEHLHDSAPLAARLSDQAERGRWLAAICAAPAVVLAPLGLLAGRRATCHPAFYERLDPALRAEDRVVVDQAGRLVTSRAPGTALEFALTLVGVLCGEQRRREVAGPMLA
jgi:protein deglycase